MKLRKFIATSVIVSVIVSCLVGFSTAEEMLSPAQLEEKYQLCFKSDSELDSVVAKELELDQLKKVDGVKAGPYKAKELIKDDPLTDAVCDKLPLFLQAICWGRTLGIYADQLVRQPTLNKDLSRKYIRYLKVIVGECQENYSVGSPQSYGILMPSGLGKAGGREAASQFAKGANAYCKRIRTVEKELTDLRKDCAPVPDLKGKTYDQAKNYLLTGLPEGGRFSSDLKVLENGQPVDYRFNSSSYYKVKNLKIIGQEPVPGVLVDRVITNLAVKLEPNVPVKLLLTPQGKAMLSPGGSLQVKVEVTYTNGEVLDVSRSSDIQWKESGTSLLHVDKGTVTLTKAPYKKGSVSLSAVFIADNESIESNPLEIEVSNARSPVALRLELLGTNLIDYGSFHREIKNRVTRIYSDSTEEVVPGEDYITVECGFESRTAGAYLVGTELMISDLSPDLLDKEIVVYAVCRDGSGGLLESNNVSLFVKKGLVIVPRIYGKTEKEARKMLTDVGLVVSKVDLHRTYDGKCVEGDIPGRVEFCYPIAGRAVALGSGIEIQLGGYRVPDIIGLSEADAKSVFQGVDLTLSFLKSLRYDPVLPAGVVKAQKPAAGKCLMKKTMVVATLNGVPTPVDIPDLIGKSEAEARDIVRPMSLLLDVKAAKQWTRGFDAGIVIDQDPKAGAGGPVDPGTIIKIWLNPSMPSIGIDVDPDQRSYSIGTELTFTQDVWNLNPNNKYTFKWELDGKPIQTGPTDKSFTKVIDTPGVHYVQLILESSDPSENDALIRNIHIDYPPDPPDPPTVTISVSPGGPYTPNRQVSFNGQVMNVSDAKEYRWSVNGKYVGSGKQFPYKLGGKGKYEVSLKVLRGNGDELKAQVVITVDDEPIKPLGKWRNRFEPVGTIANLRVCSSYWIGGYTYSKGLAPVVSQKAHWSNCSNFDTVGGVEGYDLYTGVQDGGHNSGWIAYSRAGSNKLLFKVYGFRFGDPQKTPGAQKGYRSRKGNLNTHGIIIPASIKFIRRQARAGTVQWQTEDNKTCRARIWKHNPTGPGTITKQVFITGGVDNEECVETGNIAAGSDPGMGFTGNPTTIAGATQIGTQFQNSGSSSSGNSSNSGSGGSGNLANVTVSQKNITITVWDHGQEDGDIINMFLNGKLLKGNILLTKKKKKFDVLLTSGSNMFEIEAVNEGSVSPNTASVRISHVTQGRSAQVYERKSGKKADMKLFAP